MTIKDADYEFMRNVRNALYRLARYECRFCNDVDPEDDPSDVKLDERTRIYFHERKHSDGKPFIGVCDSQIVQRCIDRITGMMSAPPDKCRWTWNRNRGWCRGCNGSFIVTNYNPVGDGSRKCDNCGKPIEEVPDE